MGNGTVALPGDRAIREVLARFLHDDPAQALAAAKISLQLARDSGDPAELHRRVAESIAALDIAIDSMRQLADKLVDR